MCGANLRLSANFARCLPLLLRWFRSFAVLAPKQLAKLRRCARPRSKVKLSVEASFLPEVGEWFLFNQQGSLMCDLDDFHDVQEAQDEVQVDGCGGGRRGSLGPRPAFFVHLSQEYFLVAEQANDILLNEFMVKWWKIPGDLTTDGDQAILRCGDKEELTGSVRVELNASKHMLRIAAEPHVLERMVCANVGGKRYPVLLEFCAHRLNARPVWDLGGGAVWTCPCAH